MVVGNASVIDHGRTIVDYDISLSKTKITFSNKQTFLVQSTDHGLSMAVKKKKKKNSTSVWLVLRVDTHRCDKRCVEILVEMGFDADEQAEMVPVAMAAVGP